MIVPIHSQKTSRKTPRWARLALASLLVFRVAAGSASDQIAVAEGPRLDPQEAQWMATSRFLDPVSGNILDDILSEVDRRLRQNPGQPPIVVFDLDDTVFDSRYGAFDALQGWLKSVERTNAELASPVYEKIRSFVAQNPLALPGSNPAEIFATLGLPADGLEYASFKSSFQKWISSREYAEKPYPLIDGVAKFLGELRTHGARIVYLSGRNGLLQMEGTRANIRQAGLPLASDADLLLRMEKVPTEAFKENTLVALDSASGVRSARGFRIKRVFP